MAFNALFSVFFLFSGFFISRLYKRANRGKLTIRVQTVCVRLFFRKVTAEYAVSVNYAAIAGYDDLVHHSSRKQPV